MSQGATAFLIIKNADRLKTAIETYDKLKSVNNALDVVQAFPQFVGVAAVAGLTEKGVGRYCKRPALIVSLIR